MPIGTPQGNLDIKNATLRTSNLETQNIKIGSIFVGTGVYSLEETANVGNSMSNTIQFTNTHTGFVTTSNVGIGTNTPLDTLHINGGTLFAGHIIPTTNATFDIGSAEKKVRDLYVDTNSLWVGDTTKIAFSGGKMKFKRRKVNQVPRMLVTLATSQSNELSTESEVQSDAVTFAQTIDASISTVSDLKLEHWRDYAKRFDTTKSVSDIFADNDDDYEAVTASEAFMEVGSNIFTEHSLSIGKTTDPTATLDIYKEDTTAAGQTVISSITGVFSGSDATGGNINNTGLYIDLDSSATGGGTSSTSPAEEHRVWGIYVDIDVTGDSDDIKGGRFLVTSSMAANGSDQNTNIYGIDAQGQHKGSGPNTNIIGVNARSFKGSDSTGLTDTMVGVTAEYEINAGTCTDAFGVRASFDRNGGAVTNSYLFYGQHIGSTTTITNNYGLYVTGADRHYLEGNVGIGTTIPDHHLHVKGTGGVRIAVESTSSYGGLELGGTSGGLIDFKTPFSDDYDARIIYSGGNLQFTGTDVRISENLDVTGTLSAGTIEASNISGTVGDTSGVKAVYFENTENDGTDYTDKSGILAFDENFYNDTEYGTGTYDPDATFVGNNGGGLLIKNEDGWGAIFTSQNTRWAKGYWNSLDVSGGVDVGGNVGIGTTNPQQKLEVHGNILLGQNDINSFIHGGAGVALSSDTDVLIVSDANDVSGAASADIIFGTGSAINMNSSRNFTYAQAYPSGLPRLEYMRILGSNGNVGIGVEAPAQLLDVAGRIRADTMEIDSYIYHVGDTNTYFGFDAADHFRIVEGGGTRFQVDSNGRIGIGTTTPASPLDVVTNSEGNYIARFFNTSTASDEDARIAIETSDAGGEVHIIFITTNEISHSQWQIMAVSGDGKLEFQYQNMTSSINYNEGPTKAGFITRKLDNVSLNFTGQHRTFIKDTPFSEAAPLEGLIVSADQNKYVKMSGGVEAGSNAITINESLPIVSLAKKANDKKCFGVISTSEDPETREESYGNFVSISQKEVGDTRVYINSVGEGSIWVTNVNGPLESGDYITTSNIVGYGMRQNDDILHNYTVAKITMDCNFEPVTQPIQVIKKELTRKPIWFSVIHEIVTEEEYKKLPIESRSTFIEHIYTNEDGQISNEEYNNLDPIIQPTYTEISKVVYRKTIKERSLEEKHGWEIEYVDSLENVLDEHGEFQWEDTDETEKAYKLRYLDAGGNITDEANHVYVAAFVGCTYHCG
jgi:hypothetical protein